MMKFGTHTEHTVKKSLICGYINNNNEATKRDSAPKHNINSKKTKNVSYNMLKKNHHALI